jgi:uncharacterized protein
VTSLCIASLMTSSPKLILILVVAAVLILFAGLWLAGGALSAPAPLLTWQLQPRLGLSSTVLRPIDHVGRVNYPKLFIVGTEDRHTTLAESRLMFEAASEPKHLWIVEGGRHVDLHQIAKEEYERRTLDFFENYLRRK